MNKFLKNGKEKITSNDVQLLVSLAFGFIVLVGIAYIGVTGFPG